MLDLPRSARALALGALAAIATLSSGCADEAAARPPIVIVVFDAFDGARVGHLGHGRPTTPHLDALAAEGTSFANAFAPAPYTLAGVASLLTGRLPDDHGLVAKKNRLAESETTLAELAKEAGYATRAVVGNPNGGAIFGNMQGFDVVVPTYELGPDRPANYTPPSTGKPLHMSEPEEAAAEFVRFAEATDTDAPFLFYAHILQPHTPYIAPEPFRSTWLDPGYDGVFAGGDNKTLIQHKWRTDAFDAADEQALHDLYDANILWADHGLGLLMDELKARGIYDEALILVTADHGEASYEHGVRGHNDTLFDEMLRVPLVVRLPASWEAPRGGVDTGLASTLDLLPTLCEVLDRPLPAGVAGQSLVERATGSTPEARRLVLRDHGTPPSVGLRTDTEKAILHRDRKGPDKRPLQPEFLFFDIQQDPAERTALDANAADWIEPLRTELQRLAEYVDDRARTGRRANQGGISSADEAMLGALGYVDEVAEDGNQE